ncbi:hypothetical protein SAY86_010317 [Trapa natans]|uniref:Rhomboid-like protein 19 n=1 Tax=Trapa natans TaxID=22666 RepID=A0AAN7QR09_TRANT|nr:hypothetical protein SAY86_010317 [Trapa natans]
MSSASLAGGTSLYGGGFTKLCKGLAVVLFCGHAAVLIFPATVTYLALIPSRTIPFAWNLITAGYLEQSTYGVVTSIIGLLFMGRLLEPIWGSREFVKFIFAVNFFTSLCVFVTAIALYYIKTEERYLYLPISGFHGILAGLLVGIKQIIPDQELPLLRIKAKWFPSIVLLLAMALSFFIPEPAAYIPILVFGTYMGWIYLRYIQTRPETKFRGDPSDDFSFASFFPEFLRPIINPVASVFARLLCGRSGASTNSHDYALTETSLPGSDSAEAARRRERGARALEERLAAERLTAARSAEDDPQRDAAANV